MEVINTKDNNFVRALVESAILIAIGVALSLLKLLELPYGGSITLASMLPVILISYRHGIGWGMTGGLAFSLIQQLLGLKNLGYVTGWQSVLAVILLDYVIAFSLSGLGGIFRKPVRDQALALTLGALLSAVLRFICHVISGATVWAGLSIPTEAALVYSIGYNATYMIPETIILTLVAFYIGSVLDFRHRELQVIRERESIGKNLLIWIGGLVILAGLIFASVMIYSKLQNPETGDFMIIGLKDVNWKLVIPVSVGALIAGAVCIFCGAMKKKNAEGNE